MHLVLIVAVENIGCNQFALFVVRITSMHLNALPVFIMSPDDFFNLFRVVFNYTICRFHNEFSRTVVLLQLVQSKVGVIFLEV